MRTEARLEHTVHGVGFCVAVYTGGRVQQLYCYTAGLLRAVEWEALLHAAVERAELVVTGSAQHRAAVEAAQNAARLSEPCDAWAALNEMLKEEKPTRAAVEARDPEAEAKVPLRAVGKRLLRRCRALLAPPNRLYHVRQFVGLPCFNLGGFSANRDVYEYPFRCVEPGQRM